MILFGIAIGTNWDSNPQQTDKSAKFKVGDCLKLVVHADSGIENEFSDTPKDEGYTIYTKLIRIGKRNYLLSFGKNTEAESPIKYTDTNFIKVDCKETKKVFDN